MRGRCHQLCAGAVAFLVARVTLAWRETPPVPRPVARGIGVPVRPSRFARRLGRVLVLLQLLYCIELVLLGHWLVAAVLPAMMLAVAHPRLSRPGANLPQRLLLAADGRMHLLMTGGAIEPVRIDGGSLRLGPWLYLRLHTGQGAAVRLLFGPDNLDAASLAALRRRLVLVDQNAEVLMPGLGQQLAPAARPSPPA